MVGKGSDRQWERFGETEPYWSVLSSEEYTSENLTEDSRKKFFLSGERHLKRVFDTIEWKFNMDFPSQRQWILARL